MTVLWKSQRFFWVPLLVVEKRIKVPLIINEETPIQKCIRVSMADLDRLILFPLMRCRVRVPPHLPVSVDWAPSAIFLAQRATGTEVHGAKT